jgi:hypothetical protein
MQQGARMNHSNTFPDDPEYKQNTKQPRTDFLTAQRIEAGLAIQRCCGTFAAAKYMQSKDIDIALVRRTLTQPLGRRLYTDWKYADQT